MIALRKEFGWGKKTFGYYPVNKNYLLCQPFFYPEQQKIVIESSKM